MLLWQWKILVLLSVFLTCSSSSLFCHLYTLFLFPSSVPCVVVFFFLFYFTLFWFVSFCVLFPPTPPAGGVAPLQVASQSAVSQEQVDSILQENDALRTNLAALEQVTDHTSSSTFTP